MQYGTIPGLAKPVSRIVQGCIMLNPEDEATQRPNTRSVSPLP